METFTVIFRNSMRPYSFMSRYPSKDKLNSYYLTNLEKGADQRPPFDRKISPRFNLFSFQVILYLKILKVLKIAYLIDSGVILKTKFS